jgi:hypothetical protein
VGRHPCSVPARAGFPHARPRPPKAESQGLSRTVACFTPPVRLRAAVATPAPLDDTACARRVGTSGDDLCSILEKCIVRLADKCPKASIRPLQVPPARAPRGPRMVLTWRVIPASRCHVRMPDITGQSHLRPVPRLALDTCRRNGHASDQAQ